MDFISGGLWWLFSLFTKSLLLDLRCMYVFTIMDGFFSLAMQPLNIVEALDLHDCFSASPMAFTLPASGGCGPSSKSRLDRTIVINKQLFDSGKFSARKTHQCFTILQSGLVETLGGVSLATQ